MDTITTTLVNATPRSNKYKYYSVGGTAYTNKKSGSQQTIADADSIIYNVQSYSDLPTDGNPYFLYVVENDKILYLWDEDASSYSAITGGVKKIIPGNNISISPITGVGDVTINGYASTVDVGTTTTGSAGTDAEVVNSGTTTNAIFDFTIPRGDMGPIGPRGLTGNTGSAGTVTVGTTTTGNPGTNASVTNSGTASAAILAFTIPRGATVEVGTTTVSNPDVSPSVSDSGTDGDVVLDFSLPRAAEITVGTITTGNPGTNVIVSNSGTDGDVVLDFTIPRGTPAGLDYSVTEQAVGTWINGDTIYQKTLPAFTLGYNTQYSTAHNITGLTRVVRVEGMASYNNRWIALPNGGDSSNYYRCYFEVDMALVTLYVYPTSQWNNFVCYATLWYTRLIEN
jgi:hypothetical protein